jgi:MoaA/NifB/PqqE/SkfB family radical SAM enzyme
MQLRKIHLEITSRCTLNCKFCARNIHKYNVNTDLRKEAIENLCLDKFQDRLKIILCGRYGDPCFYPSIIWLLKHIKDCGHELSFHTNANKYNEGWWSDIVKVIPKDHMFFFTLDGSDEETIKKYRKNLNYKQMMKNIKSFINSGGNAFWQFIVFRHNEHQIEKAKKIAMDLGFKGFNQIPSSRYDKEFEKPTILKISTRKERSIRGQGINCRLDIGEIFIGCDGFIHPCCLCGTYGQSLSILSDQKIKSLYKNNLLDILNSEYFKRIRENAETNKYCKNICNIMSYSPNKKFYKI